MVDPMLQYGVWLAPKRFNAVADALQRHLRRIGMQHLHHFLVTYFLNHPYRPNASRISPYYCMNARDWATTCIVVSVIEIDMLAGERLPRNNLEKLQVLLSQWGDKKVSSI